MGLQFNIDRPKVSDEEIKKNQDFQKLVKQFKEQSIKQAKGDESWWKNKLVRYTTIIAGVTVVCTITYNSLFNKTSQEIKNDKITTSSTTSPPKNKNTTSAIKPAAPKLAKPYTTYTVNANKGGQFVHNNGTKVRVPQNAFVDKEGKTIVGDVTIEYREFHDVGDVIASGIPMAYDSAGIQRHLQTAGMFEVQGIQNGTPVYVAPKKELTIELASSTAKSGFHQYVLDTVSGNWLYLRPDKAMTAEELQASKMEIEAHLVSLNNEIKVVIPKRIDSVKTVFNTRLAQLPKYSAPQKPRTAVQGRPSFKLDGSYDEFPELASFNDVVFEVGTENQNYSKDLHDITWSDVKVSQGPVKGINYLLTLKFRSRIEKLIVYPILNGKDLETANRQYSQRLQDYEQKLEKRETSERQLVAELKQKQESYLAEQNRKQEEYDKERARLAQLIQQRAEEKRNRDMASASTIVKATRIFRLAEFGIYNSDCPHAAPKGQKLSPIFLAGKESAPLLPAHVYLIDHTHQTVFDLPADKGFEVNLDETAEYSFCVFAGEKVFVSTKEKTQTSLEKRSAKFETKEVEGAADNVSQFKTALEL
jgi:cell division protein FtsB